MNLLSAALVARIASGSGGGGGGGDVNFVEVEGTAPVINAESGTTYVCTSEVSDVTIADIPEEGTFEIIFAAGSTAPQISGPSCLVWKEDCEIETDKMNEINILCFQIGGNQYAQGVIAFFDIPTVESSE